MASVFPFYVKQLFALMQVPNWPQKRCATALGLTRQAINRWASGRMNVPDRYRSALISLVTLALDQSLATVRDAALEQRKADAHRFISAWACENLAARGSGDQWHAEVGQQLARYFHTPLSLQDRAAWEAELALHLQAAQRLRRLLQQQQTALPPPRMDLAYGLTDDPVARLWCLADYLHGAPLNRSAVRAPWSDTTRCSERSNVARQN